MIDHTDDSLRAAIKALDEVVAPAVDGANPLAVEQLRLVSRFLGFVRQRLAYQDGRDRFELRHYLSLADELAPLATDQPGIAARSLLLEALEAARPVAANLSATQGETRAAARSLSSAVSILVRSVADADEAARRPVERAVVVAQRTLMDAQRAWFLPIGFEPDPKAVVPIDAALAAPR